MRCELCTSVIGENRKYCDWCKKTYGKKIFNIWHRRAYQKRVGNDVDNISSGEILVSKRINLTPEERKKRLGEYLILIKQGLNYRQIGKKYGITGGAVHKFLKINYYPSIGR